MDDEALTTYATMDEATRRNAIIAERLMGLRPGVDWGEFPLHDWQRNEESEYNTVWCPRCYKSHDWQDFRHGVDDIRKADPGPCWDDPPDYTMQASLVKAEAEIARRGLLGEYAEHVAEELGKKVHGDLMCSSYGDYWLDTDVLGLLITAPPDVRVRAMLRVLGEG